MPLSKVRGFRAPFLAHNSAQRTMLRENGFAWDSSIPEQFGPGQASTGEGEKLWPFTLDYGIPIVSMRGWGGGGRARVRGGAACAPLLLRPE